MRWENMIYKLQINFLRFPVRVFPATEVKKTPGLTSPGNRDPGESKSESEERVKTTGGEAQTLPTQDPADGIFLPRRGVY